MTPKHPAGPLPRAKSWLLTLYLGTAPVQWLPGVDYGWVARGKILLFVAAVGLVLVGTPSTRLRLPGGLAGPLGFVALTALAVPGLAQSSLALSAGYVGDVIAGAAMLWCFYNVARLDPVAARFIVDRSAMILAAFGVTALVLALAGRGWQSSCSPTTFRDTAFGCSRTGWSGGLALYLPILLVFSFRRDIGVLRRWSYLALAGGVVAAQAGVGGRAGLVASIVVIAVFVYYFMPRRWKVLGSAVALLAAAAVTIPTTLYEQLRLDEIPENPTSLMDWDYVSSGRVGGALNAAAYIAERPLAGHGIGAVRAEFRGGRPEIHNLWLKWAAYCGVLAPLLFLALVALLLAQTRGLAHVVDRHRSVAVSAGLVIVAGLVLSMLEPGTPFGEFQNNALWWAAAGLIVGMASERPELRGRWRRALLGESSLGHVPDRTSGVATTCAA